MSLPQEALKEIESFLYRREKLNAIRHLCDTYGFSQEESSVLVEALEKQLDSVGTGSREPDTDSRNRVADRRELFGGRTRIDTSTRSGAPPKIIAAIFGVVGAVFLAIAGFTFYSQLQFIENSTLISGRVIRMAVNSEGLSAPVIEYEWDGKKWLYASSTYSKPPAYEAGEEVPVYVNRDNPGQVVIDTFSDRWFLITVFGVLGGIFAGIAAIVAWLTIRR